jgi:AraC-like DNA-binding protein
VNSLKLPPSAAHPEINMLDIAALAGAFPRVPEQLPPMNSRILAPSAALRPFVQHFLIVEYTAGWSTTLLPGTSLVAAFRFRGECRINDAKAPNALVTGIWNRTRTLIHGGRCANVLVMFTPTGAASFLREPVERLFNGTLAMEHEARRSELDLVEEQLFEASADAKRVQVVEHFLRKRLRERLTDDVVAEAVARIRRSRGSLRVDVLAREAGLSQSALERRFRRVVGTSPKKFAGLVRLRNVVRMRRDGSTFTEIAHAAGYADQSHFIKDFKRFTGEAPDKFFRATSAFC